MGMLVTEIHEHGEKCMGNFLMRMSEDRCFKQISHTMMTTQT